MSVINPDIGKKSNVIEDWYTYAYALGFTDINGNIPASGISYVINNKMLSFEMLGENSTDSPQNLSLGGYTITNLANSAAPVATEIVTSAWVNSQVAYGIISWNTKGNPHQLLLVTGDGLDVYGINREDVNPLKSWSSVCLS